MNVGLFAIAVVAVGVVASVVRWLFGLCDFRDPADRQLLPSAWNRFGSPAEHVEFFHRGHPTPTCIYFGDTCPLLPYVETSVGDTEA
jgi:hypothetical protein